MIACRYTYKNTDNKIILKLNFIDETSVFNFVFLSITCIMEKKESLGLLFNRSYNEVGKL